MKAALPTIAFALSLVCNSIFAQSLTLEAVSATGAKPLTAVEMRDVVSGASTEFTLVNGSTRHWTANADGTFIASRTTGPANRRTAQGMWFINDDAALCITFDWGAMETESWCRRLYKVDDKYYAYSLQAKPDTLSGRYRFSK